jgi:hypothetical protein
MSATDLPSSQDWLLVTNSEVVDDGLEILGVLLGPVGGLVQRLVADALTTDVVSYLSYKTRILKTEGWVFCCLRTINRLSFMKQSSHCFLKARELQEKPGMKITAGLEGSPVDSAQIFVPSRELT